MNQVLFLFVCLFVCFFVCFLFVCFFSQCVHAVMIVFYNSKTDLGTLCMHVSNRRFFVNYVILTHIQHVY